MSAKKTVNWSNNVSCTKPNFNNNLYYEMP